MKIVLKKLIPLFSSLSIIIGAAIILTKLDSMPDSTQNLILYFSFILLAAIILLSFIFNRSAVFFIALALFISEILLMVFRTNKGIEAFNLITIKSIIYIILPVNIAESVLVHDRGILSIRGKLHILLIVFEYFFIPWIIITSRTSLIEFINSAPIHIIKLSPIPAFIFLIFCIALILFITRIILFNFQKDSLLFGVLISVFLGIFSENTSQSIPVFFLASGLLLLICFLLETYSLAYIDELTGLPSRRALKEHMLTLSGRYSIAMIDIDFFKKFNDNYGHDVGDEVLRFIGKCLKDITGGGKSFRYGGEEFTVIFPGKGISEAIPHIEKLREDISKSSIPLSKGNLKNSSKNKVKKVSITISSGVAERNEKHPDVNAVLKTADTALYRAKNKGRNCVSK